MFKNRLVNIALILLMAITLIGVVIFIIWQSYLKQPVDPAAVNGKQVEKKISAEEIEKVTVETDEIRTNLLTGDLILAKFAIQAENEKVKKELELRKTQVIHTVIKILSAMKPEEVQGPKGMEKVEAAIKTELNKLLEKGKIVDVITTHKIVDI
ncbi:flagellar basal body-associated FliL family protein [Aneurinibacillus aneurinilyticus]|uniref:flagellar basal body-associated FliL family protein n=1 Tax=Aneurinibacillus aneurinilyticus TaxID=1391 RepID=UPI002E212CAF|nr:flagellar basal body-associated FliL family protein [Aneurinibacillus aneurinilyticus]MED0669327.1 flagellar basal body-associated FliL family protein [Aneurinibacillus aneurinilyticus]